MIDSHDSRRRPRVVSLLPSASEIVAALGAAHLLVGRSHACDWPPQVARLPACTALRDPLAGDSRAVHASVTALIEAALSPFRVDAARLAALAPDVILTQSQCEVCAVSGDDLTAALAGSLGAAPAVVDLSPATLAEVAASFATVGAALGLPEAKVRATAETFRGRLSAVEASVAGRPRPRVATLEWIEPPMTAGNWVPELVAIAGGDNLFGAAGRHSPWLAWDELRAADPDAIVVMPCGFDLDRAEAESRALERLAGWRELMAVRTGRVAVVDGNRYFNRPGPRLAQSAEILAEIFHPGLDFGHRVDGWRRLA